MPKIELSHEEIAAARSLLNWALKGHEQPVKIALAAAVLDQKFAASLNPQPRKKVAAKSGAGE